jgi:hypothetical protein
MVAVFIHKTKQPVEKNKYIPLLSAANPILVSTSSKVLKYYTHDYNVRCSISKSNLSIMHNCDNGEAT